MGCNCNKSVYKNPVRKTLSKVNNIIQAYSYYLQGVKLPNLAYRGIICCTCDKLIDFLPFRIIIDNQNKCLYGKQCSICKCSVTLKTKSINEHCPLNKW
jgi:hypothetical protein